jgi:hypothetical protein
MNTQHNQSSSTSPSPTVLPSSTLILTTQTTAPKSPGPRSSNTDRHITQVLSPNAKQIMATTSKAISVLSTQQEYQSMKEKRNNEKDELAEVVKGIMK